MVGSARWTSPRSLTVPLLIVKASTRLTSAPFNEAHETSSLILRSSIVMSALSQNSVTYALSFQHICGKVVDTSVLNRFAAFFLVKASRHGVLVLDMDKGRPFTLKIHTCDGDVLTHGGFAKVGGGMLRKVFLPDL